MTIKRVSALAVCFLCILCVPDDSTSEPQPLSLAGLSLLGESLVLYRAFDDSMRPLIGKGDIIGVTSTAEPFEDGQIYLVSFCGGLRYLRRVFRSGDRFLIEAEHEDADGPFNVPVKNVESLERVIEIRKDTLE